MTLHWIGEIKKALAHYRERIHRAMEDLRTVVITNGNGERIEVELEFEGDREGGSIAIDGINYHFERLKKERLLSDYKIDDDPDYQPQTDAEGYCYLIAPFSE